MADFNNFSCSCTIGADGEFINTPNGKSLYKTRAAINGFKDDDTDWWSVKAWGYVAQKMDKWFKKGTRVILSGRVNIEKGQDGKGVYPTITVTDFTFIPGSKKKEDEESAQNSVPIAADGGEPAKAAPPIASEDIPF